MANSEKEISKKYHAESACREEMLFAQKYQLDGIKKSCFDKMYKILNQNNFKIMNEHQSCHFRRQIPNKTGISYQINPITNFSIFEVI